MMRGGSVSASKRASRRSYFESSGCVATSGGTGGTGDTGDTGDTGGTGVGVGTALRA